jgi:UPF0716 protein FxsA
VLGLLVFLLFVVLPLIEVLLLIWIGTQIGFWPTIAIVLVTGILGAALAKQQGPRAWREIGTAWQEGRIPGRELVAGALFLVGAAFLLTPGVLTDATGFLLMVPYVRSTAARVVLKVFRRHATVVHHAEGGVVRIRKIE